MFQSPMNRIQLADNLSQVAMNFTPAACMEQAFLVIGLFEHLLKETR